MLLSPSVSSFSHRGLSSSELLQFFDSGRNLYIGFDQNTKSFTRDFVKEFGAQMYPAKSKLSGQASHKHISDVNKDHLSWTKNINEAVKRRIVDIDSEVGFQGSGMKLDPQNDYVFPILKGTSGMKAELPPKKSKGNSTPRSFEGDEITLVAGYQSRYSQRAILSGSIEMCSDKFIKATQVGDDYTTSPNFKLCLELAKWNFQQKSVLKMENFTHSLVDKSLVEKGLQKEQEYKLKDEIQVSFDLYEKINNKWVPFHSEDAVKLEFIMLHPFITENMENTEGAHYRVQFNVPDHNGVYKFKIDYNVIGLSRVYYDEITPVRVFNHDEFPRNIVSAYFYFGTAFLTAGATILFVLQYALTSEEKKRSKVKED